MLIKPLITGSAQPKLNQEKLNTFSIPWPPNNLQEQYYSFVLRIDKLRFVDHIGGVQFMQSLIPDLFLSASFSELLNHLLVVVFGRRMQIE